MSSIGSELNKIIGVQYVMFKDSLLHVLRIDFIEDYLSAFDIVFDQMLVSPYEGTMSSEDLSAPSKLKPAVRNYVKSELTTKIGKLTSKEDTFSVQAISDAVFGFPSGPSRSETDPLRLFFFYLAGTPDEFVFIGADELDAWRRAKAKAPRMERSPSSGGGRSHGRFGKGFMVPMDEYKRVYAADTSIPSPSQAKHPFSGAAPINLFDIIRTRINFNRYIEKAVELMRKVS